MCSGLVEYRALASPVGRHRPAVAEDLHQRRGDLHIQDLADVLVGDAEVVPVDLHVVVDVDLQPLPLRRTQRVLGSGWSAGSVQLGEYARPAAGHLLERAVVELVQRSSTWLRASSRPISSWSRSGASTQRSTWSTPFSTFALSRDLPHPPRYRHRAQVAHQVLVRPVQQRLVPVRLGHPGLQVVRARRSSAPRRSTPPPAGATPRKSSDCWLQVTSTKV